MNTVSYTIVNSETQQKEEIRFSKTDSIGKVLNSACKAFKIRPEKHELRYAKRKLELNMNLMFSGLPDGVSLELCPATEPVEKGDLATVNLIISDGIVNSGTFRKNASLWDVSQELIPKDKFLEEDRICMSFLNKCFEGPAILKRIPLSSLKFDEGPLNLSLRRKYSSEKLNVENDNPVRRNSKTSTVSQDLGNPNRLHPIKAGISKASVNRHNSITKLEDDMNKDHVNQRKKKSDNALKSSHKPRLQGNIVRFTDKRKGNTINGNNVTTHLRAKAAIDKHFYLNPGKKLKDLKYLNSRQGISYVIKQPVGEILREDSAVDLLDLGRDSNRSSDDRIELKLFFPDKTAIQALFRYDETVEDVFKFLNPLLQCQPSDYFLYLSNPTESVEKEISLNELEDSSGVNLYLSLKPKVQKAWPKCKPYLKEENLP